MLCPCLAAESGASAPAQDSRTTSPDLFESQPLTSASSKPSSARKTPESFLGPNAALVNLDSLVTKPAPPAQSLNPFLAPGRHVLLAFISGWSVHAGLCLFVPLRDCFLEGACACRDVLPSAGFGPRGGLCCPVSTPCVAATTP